MRGEKRTRTRREKALRRLAAVVVLAAVLALLEGYCFLPSQAVRNVEENAHTGPTALVADLGGLGLKETGWSRVYLSANDNAMLITLSRFSALYGWSDYGMGALDCSEDASFHVSTYSMSKLRAGDDNWKWYIFGRVDDPAGETVSVRTCLMETGESIGEAVVIPRSDWLVHKGRSYFITEMPRYDREEYGWLRVDAELLDGAGETLAREENVQGWSTGLG